jgi:hypothetical protein
MRASLNQLKWFAIPIGAMLLIAATQTATWSSFIYNAPRYQPLEGTLQERIGMATAPGSGFYTTSTDINNYVDSQIATYLIGQPQITPTGAEYVFCLPTPAATKRCTSVSVAQLLLALSNTWTAGQACSPVALAFGATVTPDFNQCNVETLTLTGNAQIANPANARAGYCGQIFLTQDGSGSRTASFGSSWKFANGVKPTLSTAPGATDVLSFCTSSPGFIVAQLLPNVQ